MPESLFESRKQIVGKFRTSHSENLARSPLIGQFSNERTELTELIEKIENIICKWYQQMASANGISNMNLGMKLESQFTNVR